MLTDTACCIKFCSECDVKRQASLLVVFPLVVAISFFLIADIDSPRGGIIHVSPQNLFSLAESLRGP